MKTKIPEELASDVPHTKWGKILLATPVVMTVIATLLAGLASSEMTKAQYDRALGAQLQSKAGDQWSYFQAKKLRGAMQRTSLELLQATTEVHPLDATNLLNADAATIAALTKSQLPEAAPAGFDDDVKAALDAVENSKPESEIAAALARVSTATLAKSFTASRDAATAFDNATESINRATSGKLDSEMLIVGDKNMFRDFTAAKMRYDAARYDAEAKLNQTIANVLELQVREANVSAERHHKRSGKFFFGMLATQAAVIVSTFAIAAQKRNFLWSLAALAGLAAIIFAIYVYLRV